RLASIGVNDPLVLEGGRPRQREAFSITNNNLAPRLSLSWDPRSDGKAKAFASWGRFYGNLFLQAVVGEQGPDLLSPYYEFDEDGVNAVGLPDHQVGNFISSSPPSATQVDRGLKTPFTDELTIGWEQEIAPELSLSLTHVRRAYRMQLQDIDVNHTVRRPPRCERTGTASRGFCDDFGVTLVPIDPSVQYQRNPDGYPDLYIENLDFNQVFRVGNYNYQEYASYELHLVRRLRRKWQLDASYVYSKATGQAESFLSESGNDPALTELKTGYLSYDQRHVAKFHAVAYLPGDWQLGGSVNWSSGLPFSFVNRVQTHDNVEFIQTRRLFGSRDPYGNFLAENRNDHRNHPAYELSVRARKSFVLGRAAAGAFFEVYNLLNTDDLRLIEIDNHAEDLESDEIRQFGRRFQMGLQIQF
ncbi:MAG TPA: hypothetical protein VGR38_08365, partial [Candidatus Polarisedimenticolia bacterium]|nr:hypothetical protein [Candidatus Polarisedimenticolia bacterium]